MSGCDGCALHWRQHFTSNGNQRNGRSQRRTEEAAFEGTGGFELERDTLFDILADSRVVRAL